MSQEQERLNHNKQTAMRFYQIVVSDRDYEGARALVGDTYIQHNPDIAHGFDALVHAMENNPKWSNRPKSKREIIYPVAEGDIVYFQVVLPAPEGQRGTVWERFRLDENGKIVEHWDAPVFSDLASSKNDAPLY